jgi:hypothetical protein
MVMSTPPPVYTTGDTRAAAPPKLDPHDLTRIGAAVSAAKRLYPGAIGQCLVDTLEFYRFGGHRVSHSSLPARLVDELLRPPT